MADSRVTGEMASVKEDVRRRLDEAVAAILALAWEYREAGFRFEDHPDLDDRVNAILRALSDRNLADAEKRVKSLLLELELSEWYDESLEYAERETDGENALWRLDMHSSHLKELLAGWIAVAAAQKLSPTQTRILFYRHFGAPQAAGEWRASGLPKPHWGRGYQTDVLTAMTVVAQNVIFGSYQRAAWLDARARGARYFIRHRGSGYYCPECDSYCERRIPIEEYIGQTHNRCVCWNEYIYE